MCNHPTQAIAHNWKGPKDLCSSDGPIHCHRPDTFNASSANQDPLCSGVALRTSTKWRHGNWKKESVDITKGTPRHVNKNYQQDIIRPNTTSTTKQNNPNHDWGRAMHDRQQQHRQKDETSPSKIGSNKNTKQDMVKNCPSPKAALPFPFVRPEF